jgi:hypothetical protein
VQSRKLATVDVENIGYLFGLRIIAISKIDLNLICVAGMFPQRIESHCS